MPTSLDEKTINTESSQVSTTAVEFNLLQEQEAVRFDRRLLKGMRLRSNWVQLFLFALVGASGFVVNMAVCSLMFEVAHLHYGIAATIAFIVALANNFIWNRKYTFNAAQGHAGFQAARFVTISIVAFLFSFAILNGLVILFGVPPLLAQAIGITLATPFNFLGNRLWSFATKSA